MSNKAPELKAYGERCSHCGTGLEAGGPDGPPTFCACGRCGCMFFEGEVVAFMYPSVREPACLPDRATGTFRS
jgi:hypothetical protein